MKTFQCHTCGKSMAVDLKTCPYCHKKRKKESSRTTKPILLTAAIVTVATAAVTTPLILSENREDKNLPQTDNKQSLTTKAGTTIQHIIKKTKSIPADQTPATITAKATITTEQPAVAEPRQSIEVEAKAVKQTAVPAQTSTPADSQKLKRQKYWQDYYKKKFKLPSAGQIISLRLKKGTVIRGKFMGIVNPFIKILINEEVKSISKAKLSTRSQLRYFCNDYVHYFSRKKLTEEGLN